MPKDPHSEIFWRYIPKVVGRAIPQHQERFIATSVASLQRRQGTHEAKGETPTLCEPPVVVEYGLVKAHSKILRGMTSYGMLWPFQRFWGCKQSKGPMASSSWHIVPAGRLFRSFWLLNQVLKVLHCHALSMTKNITLWCSVSVKK